MSLTSDSEAVEREAAESVSKLVQQAAWSARTTMTRRQVVAASTGLMGIAMAFAAAPLIASRALLALLSLAFLASIGLRSVFVGAGLMRRSNPPPPLEDHQLPRYTVIVAMYREAPVVPALCHALLSLDYPRDRLQVILACEEHDHETVNACLEHASPDWIVLRVPTGEPQTKPRALNAAFEMSTGELITVYDAEDSPDPDQLKKAAALFAAGPERLASVQARLDIHNQSETIISRCFALEYLTLFDTVLAGIAHLRCPMPLGGTSTHFRSDVIRDVGGWDPWNVTEDCELGVRLAANGYLSDVLDSTTMEEAVTSPSAWIKQRSRWIKGYAQTALVMLRRPLILSREIGPARYAAGLLTVGSVPFVLLVQPFVTVFLIIHLADVVADGRSEILVPLFPEPLPSLALVSFTFGFFLLIFQHAIAAHRAGRPELVAPSILLPVYLLMGSVAAWKGCLQLVRRPHFWDKTVHGVTASTSVVDALPGCDPSAPDPARPIALPDSKNLADPQAKSSDLGLRDRGGDTWSPRLAIFSAIALFLSAMVSRSAFLAYSDAPAHLNTARRLLDNSSPGLDQLGLHWMPLYHVLLAPFVLSDFLYRTGWAGSIASILAGVVAIQFLYRLARRCGGTTREAWAIGVAVLTQTSFLYVSVVPMHYSLLMATTFAAAYYLSRWVDLRDSRSLLLSASAVSLATLTHFDAWLLLPAGALIVGFTMRQGGDRRGRLGDWWMWLMLAASGLTLFVFLNIWWKGSPVAFLQAVSDGGSILNQSHGGWFAVFDHPRAIWVLAGPILSVLGILGSAAFAWRWRSSGPHLVALLLLYPVLFFMIQALTVGSLIEPAVNVADWRNLRYAATTVPALVFFAVIGWSNRRGLALGVATLLIGVGVFQIASDRDPAKVEAMGDVAFVKGYIDSGSSWLRESVGSEKVILLRSSLQERFELASNLPGSQFVDDNDAIFDSTASGTVSPRSGGIGWLVRVRMMDKGFRLPPIPKALRVRLSSRPCASFGRPAEGSSTHRASWGGEPWVTIWRLGSEC